MRECRRKGGASVTTGNPYAPPTQQGPPFTELSLSEEGLATVNSLARWMRIVSVFFFVFAGLMALMALVSLLGGAMGIIMMFVLGAFAVLMGFAGNWLRDAASHFSQGVATNEEISLGFGFRALRRFFIMYGIFNIIGLLAAVWDVLGS